MNVVFLNRPFAALAFLAYFIAGCGASDSPLQAGAGLPVQSAPAAQPLLLAPRAFDDRLVIEGEDPVTFDLLANDTGHGPVTVSPATPAIGASGGRASIDSNGLLSYTPPPGSLPFSETFRYTISNARGSSTATISASRLTTIYVDANVNGAQSGTKAHPYKTLGQALGVGRDINVIVAFGDYTAEAPVISLTRGQTVTGAKFLAPTFHSRFVVPGLECGLSNLALVGDATSTEPLLKLQGYGLQSQPFPHLVLTNLILKDHGGPALELPAVGQTEVTNVTVVNVNQTGGRAAVTVSEPIGHIKFSNLSITGNSAAGIYLTSTTSTGLPTDLLVPAEFDGVFFQGVDNPIVVESMSNQLSVMMNRIQISSGAFAGTLLKGTIGGSARVDGLFTNFDLSQLGRAGKALDWTYSDQSTGTLKLGNVNNSYNPDSPRNNPLAFSTFGQAAASYVTRQVHLSPNNSLTFRASGSSTLKTRIEDYSWAQPGVNSPPAVEVLLYAEGRSNLYSRMRESVYPSGSGIFYSHFFWRTGNSTATILIESLNVLTDENRLMLPEFFDIVTGLFTKDFYNILFNPGSIRGADPGSLSIPEF